MPAAVALITAYESIEGNILKLAVMCLVSTIAVIGVTGGVSQFIVRMQKKKECSVVTVADEDEEDADDE